MLRIYHSNDLLVLKDLLVHQMLDRPLSPLQAEQIVVQSQGMSHWLKLKIAEQVGVSANLEFPLPSNFVWQLYNRLFPELPERSHFDKSQMQWKLMRLLPGLLHQEACASIAQYLEQDDDGIKCFQFAQTIADLFDQYLVYRPDWLIKWEAGSDDLEDTEVSLHPWQPIVWRALVAETESLSQSLKHRARLHTELKAQVARHPTRLDGLPKRIFVFGIAALPACYWQVLEAISEKVEIHYFLLNPCRNYWGDLLDDRARARLLQRTPEVASYLGQGNSLLASWGKTGRDFLTQVHETELCQDVQAWVDFPAESGSQNPSHSKDHASARADRLLGQIQQDILQLQDRRSAAFQKEALTSSEFKSLVAQDDDSVRLISAHSPIREVQRLYDQLLHWFDRDSSLRPRDVLVMVPDIDQYAPYIDAVFSSAALTESDQHLRIPWAIADQSLVAENPLIESFLELLGLPDHRLGLSDVMDWLQVPAIRSRFGIEESDLLLIEGWLEKANVKWGLDARHRQQQGLTAFDQNSWSRGLRQLLLGAMTPDQSPGWQGDWPVSAVEGSDLQLLGQLMFFLQRLEYWRSHLSQRLMIPDLQTRLLALIDDFFDLEHLSDVSTHEGKDSQLVRQSHNSVQLIREALSDLQQDLELAGWSKASASDTSGLSIAVVRRHLTEALGEQGGWQRFLAGPVNFCTLMPMRSIPFRAICLLGMNDTDYPRQVTPVSFDLVTVGKSRLGDRSRRDDDRYLFLEALCSAQEFFYVSYRGRSQQDNSEKQPSVLVSELMDYIFDGFCLSQDRTLPHLESRTRMEQWLVEELPLQPFNPEPFRSGSNGHSEGKKTDPASPRPTAVRGYSPLWASLANAFQRPTLNAGVEAGEQNAQNAGEFLDTRLALQEPFAVRGEDSVLHLTLDWDDVKKAMVKPCEFFFRRRLKANLSAWDHHEQEVEPFGLEGLNGYQVKESVLQAIMTQGDPASAGAGSHHQQTFVEQQQALGKLPVGALGGNASSLLFDGYQPLAEQLARVEGERQDSKSLMVTINWQSESWGAVQADIEGERVDAFGEQLVRYRVGRLKGVHWFEAWMDLVLEALTEPEPQATQVTSCILLDQEGGRWRLPRPTAEQAQGYVQACLDFYLSNWCRPEPLDVNALWSAMTRDTRGDGFSEKQLAEARRTLDSPYSQSHQPAWQRSFPDFGPNCRNGEWLGAWLAGYQWIFEDCLALRIENDDPSISSGSGASVEDQL